MCVRLIILCSVFISFAGLLSYQDSHAQSSTGAVNADPDFDGPLNNTDGTPGVWKIFKISNPGPGLGKHPTEGWPKGPSLWIVGDAITYDGGVYQSVAVTPGRGYHFEVAWAVVRHGGVLVRDDVNLVRQVGIDPTGGTNPLSPNVQWSGEYRGTGKFPPELAIDQFALGDHISIFLRAKNFYTDSRTEVFFDHAILTDNGAAPIAVASPTRPPATPTATKPNTPTPVRTRVALAATNAPTLAPTFTPLPINTAPSTTVTRTPRATATPEPIAPASSDFSYTAILLVAGICVLSAGAIIVLGIVILFIKMRQARE